MGTQEIVVFFLHVGKVLSSFAEYLGATPDNSSENKDNIYLCIFRCVCVCVLHNIFLL